MVDPEGRLAELRRVTSAFLQRSREEDFSEPKVDPASSEGKVKLESQADLARPSVGSWDAQQLHGGCGCIRELKLVASVHAQVKRSDHAWTLS